MLNSILNEKLSELQVRQLEKVQMKGPKRPNVKSDGYSDAKCKSDIELKGDSDTKFESDTNSDTDIQAKAKEMLERSNTADDETTSFRLMNDENKNGKPDVP